MKKILIGIDPGVNNGIALLQEGVLSLKCLNFWETCNFLETILTHAWAEEIPVKCYLEDPTQNKPTFHRNVNQKGMQKISQNVGSNKRDAVLLKEFLENKGVEVILCKPTKYSNTKMEAEVFKKMTGYTKRTNQHERDAGMLIWGR